MYVLYEDSGNLKADRVFSRSESTMQVETESGKRNKIKNNSVLFDFEQPAPAQLLEQAKALADTLEIDFLWECAPQEEVDAASLAEEYFGHAPSAVEKTALILALSSAPAYFHRRGKGRYRPAPPDILTAALAAIEKKRQQALLQQEWTDQLAAGQLPAAIADMAMTLLIRPDKNTMQWKALDAAVHQLNSSPEKVLLAAGAWPHELALHRQRFLAENFPRGAELAQVAVDPVGQDLPLADVTAYSVDDISTNEVDDALSVVQTDDSHIRVGIHIAVPALAIARDGEFDKIARARMSTVYAPGQKNTHAPRRAYQRVFARCRATQAGVVAIRRRKPGDR
jgi:exoribonuclease-2